MIKYFIIGLVLSMGCNTLKAQDADAAAPISDPLLGEWTIDLRPTPSAEGYCQNFEVTAVDGNTFTGTFYGSEIQNGLLNRN
jgi:hypothetical protein